MAAEQIPGINPDMAPTGTGCVECLAGDGPGWWFHLRRCTECGQIGCCDSSPSTHASRHAAAAGHPFLASFEPGEDWLWNAETQQYYEGPALAPPTSHPADQPVPGPDGKVPADWQNHLR